ncbi:MAG: 3-demethylubiquinone-9 3-methyltransferase [Chloroflexi bacterium OLB14]|nr:MAG: 3-demethylubiquinone-9 3-methyltransferase [Chloroflexi bacterium OLB14]
MNRITPFLWFDTQAEEAMNYYVSIFKNSKVLSSNPQMVNFILDGQEFIGLNAGPQHKFNEAVSFFVQCENQTEVDYYWNKLIADGGEEGPCGWCKDKFGLWWQVIPNQLGELMGDPNPEKAQRVVQAMLQMQKIVVADLEKAYNQK